MKTSIACPIALVAMLIILSTQDLLTQSYPQPAHPEWFKAIPMINADTPEWATVMYTSDTDFLTIDSLKRAYYKTHPYVKNIHIQNYKHWWKIVSDHINEEGLVELPAAGETFRRTEKRKKDKQSALRSSSNSWTNIGPGVTYKNNGSQEKRPTQANIYCLGVAPSNPSVVYAGAETGGIFKTIDKGLTWTPVSHDYAIGNSQDIKVDPLDENIVYVARDKEIYKTTDGGATWALAYTHSTRVEQFYIHPTDTDTLYTATRSGVFCSEDGGNTWISKYNGYVYDIETRPGSQDTIYIAVKNDVTIRPEIMRSIDAGNNWMLMDNGYYSPSNLSESTVYGCKIGVTPADPDRVYAGIIANGKAGDNGWIGIYYSEDGGDSWSEDSGFDGGPYASGNDPATNWYAAGYSSGYHQGFYNFDIDVSHTDPDKLWIGTIWFCESGNKGGNIEYIRGTRSLEMHADIQDIDVHGSDIWIASDGGINFSDDECQSTEVRMDGITASDFWGFGMGWNDDLWTGGRYHNGNAVYHNNYGVGNSVFLGGAENATGYVNPLDNRKTYYTDITDKYVPLQLDEASSNISNLGLYPTESFYHFSYSEMEWHPSLANVIYTGKDNDLYKSIDGGITFDSLYQFPGEIRRFEISRANPNYIYAIVYHSYWVWRVHKSTDGGQTFTELAPPPYTSGSWRNISLTLNPFDEKEIWLASNSSSNGNKIYSSTDSGTTWTNHYSPVIAGEAIKDMIYQASPAGDKIYTMTNDGFFYFDKTSAEWIVYDTGLPVQHRGFMILPFYRDNKLRMASAKGIWEIPFQDASKVQAMPMVAADSIYCTKDTITLESHSIIENAGASWLWTIDPTPTYISDATERNPSIVLGNPGSYDVTLEVTSADGQSDNALISDFIQVENGCTADTIPGDAIDLPGGNGNYAVIPELNLNTNTFTVSCWIKPDGVQNDWAGLYFCRGGTTTAGLSIAANSELRYHWDGSSWWWSSGAYIESDKWSHVALVITPTTATIYLNGVGYTRNNTHAAEAFDATSRIGNDPNSGSRTFKGQIDELCLWDRALSQSEIRLSRHLTKDDLVTNDPNLIAYYQFNNQYNSQVLDKANINHATLLNGTALINSDVPVGGGLSSAHTVNGPISVASSADLDLNFVIGTQPDGELVITHLNIQPDTITQDNQLTQGYWIINNYGINASFTSLEELVFAEPGYVGSSDTPTQYTLYRRDENASGPVWTVNDTADALTPANSLVHFSTGQTIEQSAQLIVSKENVITSTATIWIGTISTEWDNPANWDSNTVPTETSDVVIPSGTPYDPIVNTNVHIKTLEVHIGANLLIPYGLTFDVAID